MSKKILSLLMIAVMIAVSAPVATAAEGTIHYVNEGERIQDAIDSANAGDTIILNPGVYDDGVLYIEKSITLRGSGAEATLLVGSIILGEREQMDGRQAIDITCVISEMSINNIFSAGLDGMDSMPAIVGFMYDAAPDADGIAKTPSSVSVTDCTIMSQEGIYLVDIDYVNILRNKLYGHNMYRATTPLDGGDTPEGTGIRVEHCDNVNIDSNAVMLYREDGINVGECYDVRIANNIAYESGDWGISASAETATLAHNTLYGNRYGIEVIASETYVVNNIVALSSICSPCDGYTPNDIYLDAEYNLVFANNDIYRYMSIPLAPLDSTNPWSFPLGYDIRLTSSFGSITVAGNIFEDPLLPIHGMRPTAPAAGCDGAPYMNVFGIDSLFKIAETSPCKDAGLDASGEAYGSVCDDYFGTARPQGGRYDIGAYEVQGYAPASMQPLVSTALSAATQSWNSILGSLPGTLTGDQQALLDMIQAHIAQAKSRGNPIAANGALQQALAQMEALMATL